jgi:RNA polymerase sigma-70 factor (ECF subfamily)
VNGARALGYDACVSTPASDLELLARWRDGDARAADELLARHFAAVVRVFRYKADDVLDDLVQQTFLACVERRDAILGADKFRPYLLRVAYSLLRRHFEQKGGPRGRIDPLTTSLQDIAGGSPSSLLALARSQANVITALRSLPLEFQLALELFYWEELSARDIATVLGVPEGTVRSRLRLGRERLRSSLAALEAHSEPAPARELDVDARARALRDADS